jgi:hypothetical protein
MTAAELAQALVRVADQTSNEIRDALLALARELDPTMAPPGRLPPAPPKRPALSGSRRPPHGRGR